MKRFILYILLFIFILAPTTAEAKRKPTAKEQREFTEKYNEMKDKGGDSFKKWQDSVNRQGAGDKGDIETEMLVNLAASSLSLSLSLPNPPCSIS